MIAGAVEQFSGQSAQQSIMTNPGAGVNSVVEGQKSLMESSKKASFWAGMGNGAIAVYQGIRGMIHLKKAANKNAEALVAGTDPTQATQVQQLQAQAQAHRNVAGEAAGGAITATSANRHGALPPRTLGEVTQHFPEMFVVPGESGAAAEGTELPSTLLDVRASPFKVLREGAVPKALLQEWLGK